MMREPDEKPDSAVRCDGVSHTYGPLVVLRNVSYELRRAEFAYLVGPSGAGKTTMLRLIQGQLRPRSGRLWVDGAEVPGSRWSRGGGGSRRNRRRVAALFGDPKLLEEASAAANVVYALRVADLTLPAHEAERRAKVALEHVGLEPCFNVCPPKLSRKERQQLAIGRALAAEPSVLLADEPTAGLDRADAMDLMDLLRSIAARGTSVLVATADASLAAGSGCRRLELARGRLVSDRIESRAAPALTLQ